MKPVYLDNAASTKVMPEVIKGMTESYEEIYANPSSTHRLGQKAKGIIERYRSIIAGCLGVETNEIIFTSGGAEGNNLVLRGFEFLLKPLWQFLLLVLFEDSLSLTYLFVSFMYN